MVWSDNASAGMLLHDAFLEQRLSILEHPSPRLYSCDVDGVHCDHAMECQLLMKI